MSKRDGYFFYEAGQAVAAVHLGISVRVVSHNPGIAATDILLPRDNPKVRMILWLTGMAAEKKGAGASDPLRRTRNRQRVRTLVDSAMEDMAGPNARRNVRAHNMLNQAQDRANFICMHLFGAIETIAARLRQGDMVTGEEVGKVVAAVKMNRAKAGGAEVLETGSETQVREDRGDEGGAVRDGTAE